MAQFGKARTFAKTCICLFFPHNMLSFHQCFYFFSFNLFSYVKCIYFIAPFKLLYYLRFFGRPHFLSVRSSYSPLQWLTCWCVLWFVRFELISAGVVLHLSAMCLGGQVFLGSGLAFTSAAVGQTIVLISCFEIPAS